MYDRILVPTDGSVGSLGVLDHALRLAEAHGATVHGLYVVNTASYASFSMETAWEGIGDMLRDEGEGALEAVRERAEAAGVPVETAMLEGSPSREIVRYAEDHDCDLVVMGTHGRGGIDRLLLGSVAERVVRASEVPVLTVRVSRRGADEEAGS